MLCDLIQHFICVRKYGVILSWIGGVIADVFTDYFDSDIFVIDVEFLIFFEGEICRLFMEIQTHLFYAGMSFQIGITIPCILEMSASKRLQLIKVKENKRVLIYLVDP